MGGASEQASEGGKEREEEGKAGRAAAGEGLRRAPNPDGRSTSLCKTMYASLRKLGGRSMSRSFSRKGEANSLEARNQLTASQ